MTPENQDNSTSSGGPQEASVLANGGAGPTAFPADSTASLSSTGSNATAVSAPDLASVGGSGFEEASGPVAVIESPQSALSSTSASPDAAATPLNPLAAAMAEAVAPLVETVKKALAPLAAVQAAEAQAAETTPLSPDDEVKQQADKLRQALSLSAVLIELRGRVLEAKLRGAEETVRDASDGFWLASTWRGLFSRAVDLHLQLLGDAEVDLAQYNMSFDKPRYMTLGIGYANIGLTKLDVKFKLVEKLRQSLNFLICMYQKHDTYEEVIQQIFEGENPALILPPDQPDVTQYRHVLDDLSEQVEALITAWDNYVRERLYAGSNATLLARFSYSAGRTLTSLSWDLTIQTAQYRVKGTKEKYAGREVELGNAIYQVFLEAFKPQNTVHLQRQLSTILDVLEKEYYLKNPNKVAQTEKEEADENFDLKSPRAAINSVIQSLNYWQNTILELSEHGKLQRQDGTQSGTEDANMAPTWADTLKLHPSWSYEHLLDMRSSLIEQYNNWFNLISGRQDLDSFKLVDIASNLIQDYSRQITSLAGHNLQAAFTQITNEIKEVAEAGIDVAKSVANAGISALTGSFRHLGFILVAAAVIIVVGVVGLLLFNNSAVSALLLGGAAGAGGTGIFSRAIVQNGKTTLENSKSTSESTLTAKSVQSQQNLEKSANVGAVVLAVAGELRLYLETAFNKGFSQLQRELGLVSGTLAVTGPLVEFVVRNCDHKNELEFLTAVLWNKEARDTQLNRIVIAAFGPLGAFLVAEDSQKPADIGSPQAEARS